VTVSVLFFTPPGRRVIAKHFYLTHTKRTKTHRDTLGRVKLNHFLEQVNALWLQCWENPGQVLGVPLRELMPEEHTGNTSSWCSQRKRNSRCFGIQKVCTPCFRVNAGVHCFSAERKHMQNVPVSELAHSRPDFLIWSAQQLEDVQQLLQLAVSRKQGCLGIREKIAGNQDSEEPATGVNDLHTHGPGKKAGLITDYTFALVT